MNWRDNLPMVRVSFDPGWYAKVVAQERVPVTILPVSKVSPKPTK